LRTFKRDFRPASFWALLIDFPSAPRATPLTCPQCGMGYPVLLHRPCILSLACWGFCRLIAIRARLSKRFISRISGQQIVTRYTMQPESLAPRFVATPDFGRLL